MNSHNYIVIQTVLRPMKVVSILNNEFASVEVADFASFFAAMEKLTITAETRILVNRGPGSYAGIRTGVAYAYGLIHGKLVDASQVKSYTSFDYVRAVTSHQGPIYLKAWPRLASGTLEGSKGYLEVLGRAPAYVEWEGIKGTTELLTIGEEPLKTELEYKNYQEILNDAVGFRELTNMFDSLTETLEPLYINPVHIT